LEEEEFTNIQPRTKTELKEYLNLEVPWEDNETRKISKEFFITNF